MSNQKNSKAVAVIAVLVVVLLGVCAVFAVYVARTHDATPDAGGDMAEESRQREYLVTEDNVEQVKEELQQNPTDASYNVTMNMDWTCSAETYEVKNAYIANSTANNRTVYFNLILPETEEVLYSSPFIAVGQEMRGFTLEEELPVGKYVVWVEYHLVDDEEKELSTVTVTATITVK